MSKHIYTLTHTYTHSTYIYTTLSYTHIFPVLSLMRLSNVLFPFSISVLNLRIAFEYKKKTWKGNNNTEKMFSFLFSFIFTKRPQTHVTTRQLYNHPSNQPASPPFPAHLLLFIYIYHTSVCFVTFNAFVFSNLFFSLVLYFLYFILCKLCDPYSSYYDDDYLMSVFISLCRSFVGILLLMFFISVVVFLLS